MTRRKQPHHERERAERGTATERKSQILAAAIYLAGRVGHRNITRDSVATHCGVSGPLVARYYGTMAKLKARVFKEAMRLEIMPVLKHCVADPSLDNHPEVKANILEYLKHPR